MLNVEIPGWRGEKFTARIAQGGEKVICKLTGEVKRLAERGDWILYDENMEEFFFTAEQFGLIGAKVI